LGNGSAAELRPLIERILFPVAYLLEPFFLSRRRRHLFGSPPSLSIPFLSFWRAFLPPSCVSLRNRLLRLYTTRVIFYFLRRRFDFLPPSSDSTLSRVFLNWLETRVRPGPPFSRSFCHSRERSGARLYASCLVSSLPVLPSSLPFER